MYRKAKHAPCHPEAYSRRIQLMRERCQILREYAQNDTPGHSGFFARTRLGFAHFRRGRYDRNTLGDFNVLDDEFLFMNRDDFGTVAHAAEPCETCDPFTRRATPPTSTTPRSFASRRITARPPSCAGSPAAWRIRSTGRCCFIRTGFD